MTQDVSGSPLSQVLRDASQTLAAAGCDTPRLDAEVLLAHVLGCDRAWLYAHPEHRLSAPKLNAYRPLISRRVGREPVAYLTGHKEFFGQDFVVTPDVLIPRPETECLVEQALDCAASLPLSPIIADVGSGSGAVAVSLAVHLPQARVIALDVSPAALAVTRRNAARHGVAQRVHCLQADLLASLTGPLDLVVANPPYLSQAELASASPEVAGWEPRVALHGGSDGLAVIRRIVAMAAYRLGPGSALLMEIGATQGAEALGLAQRHFPQANLQIVQDYAGRDRLLVVRCPNLAKAPSL